MQQLIIIIGTCVRRQISVALEDVHVRARFVSVDPT
jgi:hypothetical protein